MFPGPDPLAQFASTIDDNSLYTGREVKRLLSQVAAHDTSPYIKISAAIEITRMKRSTLKSAAPRYWHLQQTGERPPIRVRRTSTNAGAHWLFSEADCWAMRRANDEPAAAASEPEDPLVAEYVSLLTQNM